MPVLNGHGRTHNAAMDHLNENLRWHQVLYSRRRCATGLKMIPNFAKALNVTHKFLHAMGSKIAPNKSYNFSSNKKAKEWLKQTRWGNINSEVEVVADLRYLGAHLTTTSSTSSGTLYKRWEKAAQQLRKLRYCPTESEATVRVILSKVYAAALYGVEAPQATPQQNCEAISCRHRRL